MCSSYAVIHSTGCITVKGLSQRFENKVSSLTIGQIRYLFIFVKKEMRPRKINSLDRNDEVIFIKNYKSFKF